MTWRPIETCPYFETVWGFGLLKGSSEGPQDSNVVMKTQRLKQPGDGDRFGLPSGSERFYSEFLPTHWKRSNPEPPPDPPGVNPAREELAALCPHTSNDQVNVVKIEFRARGATWQILVQRDQCDPPSCTHIRITAIPAPPLQYRQTRVHYQQIDKSSGDEFALSSARYIIDGETPPNDFNIESFLDRTLKALA